MRCANCQATNPDSAAFCGQCYQRFTPVNTDALPPVPGPDDPAPTTLEEPFASAPDDPDQDSAAIPGDASAAAGRFVAEGGRLSWTCAVCNQVNDLSVFTCPICGTRMDAEESLEDRVDWDAAMSLERIAPGAGHLRAGMTGMGWVRAGMVVLWLIGGVLLATSGSAGLLGAIPLVIGIGVIWLTGPGDLDAARRGRQPRLQGRTFMFLVVGVTVGMIILGGLGILL